MHGCMDGLANGCIAEGCVVHIAEACTDTKMDMDGATATERRTYYGINPPATVPSCAYSCIGMQPLPAMIAGLLRQLRLKPMHLGRCSISLLTDLVGMRLLHL